MASRNGILFDLDGTLWEVTDRTYESVNQITKKHNLKEITVETVRGVFGSNREEAARIYFPDLKLEEAIKLLDEISDVNIENLRKYGGNVYANLEEVLEELIKEYDLFIVSNTSHKEYIEAFLNSSNLNKYFKDYLAASAFNISKAEAIQKMIKEYDIEKSVYVGDTLKDKEASEKASIPFIQAKYGFGSDLGTKYYINDITELPKVIQKIF